MFAIHRFRGLGRQNKSRPQSEEWPILTTAVLFAHRYGVAQPSCHPEGNLGHYSKLDSQGDDMRKGLICSSDWEGRRGWGPSQAKHPTSCCSSDVSWKYFLIGGRGVAQPFDNTHCADARNTAWSNCPGTKFPCSPSPSPRLAGFAPVLARSRSTRRDSKCP